jgi:hypothetical protein
MKNNIKRKQAISGKWYRVGMYETCCDCGLSHKIQYKVILKNDKAEVYFRAWRDKKRTNKNRLTNMSEKEAKKLILQGIITAIIK